MTRSIPAAGILVASLALAACAVRPYDLGGGSGSDGGTTIDDGNNDDGQPGIDAMPPDATPTDACLPSPEQCNNKDDDCDGVVDNGFDLQNDPNNCGSCGHACTFTHQFGVCTTGTCGPGACQPGYWDIDGNAGNGCEYFCIQTNGGTEICDGVDNDCNGQIDEGFPLNTTTDCGACGHACITNNATATCATGTCAIQQCNAGFVDVNGDPADGCEYHCTPTNGGVEACDGVDNDCNGVVDDGNPGGGQSCGSSVGACSAGTTSCSFGVLFCVGAVGPSQETCNTVDDDCDGKTDEDWNFQTDAANCGSCNHVCAFPNAAATCGGGACQLGACTPGFYNLDGNAANGCEYQCANTGAEKCNGVDDDCDGASDEGFNLQTDPNNCGVCGKTCSFPNASATCTTGACALGTCSANFYDLDGNPANGCEYFCVKSNGGVEACDGKDNNCNGQIDEGNPGAGQQCGTNVGACDFGTTTCSFGQIVCSGGITPAPEQCDHNDDDCDGTADEGFDKLNDPRYCNNCAGCGTLPHAVAGCSAGSCTVAQCLNGYVDLDKNVANGCEYQCTVTGKEVCDGLDNDCDGQTDEAAALTQPPNFCKTQGACAGTTPTCGGASGWVCNYTSPDVEKDGSGNVVAEETRCDNKDNDCDGTADEAYPQKNAACNDGGKGICQGTGTYICNGAGTGVTCNITTPGQAKGTESCNGKDDDCDGVVDNGAATGNLPGQNWITMATGHQIMAFEASRPDATDANVGTLSSAVCAKSGVQPWIDITAPQAQAACVSVGAHLCSEEEWQRACSLVSPTLYPVSEPAGNNGTIFLEAEDYSSIATGTDTGGTTRGWEPDYTQGFSGMMALRAEPDTGASFSNAQAPAQAPRLDFQINITKTGNHTVYVHVFGINPGGTASSGNRVWAGINTTLPGTAVNTQINATTGSWTWVRGPQINVTATGNHYVSIYMARDGVKVDAIVVSQSNNLTPTNTSGPGNTFAYDTSPNTYQPTTCNGQDSGNGGSVIATGTLASCDANWSGAKSFDLTGNVKEWTLPRVPGVNPIRGGAANDIQGGLTCQLSFTAADDKFFFPNVGFRCCR